MNWAEQWQYRANLLMYLFYWLVSPIIYLAVWTSIANSKGSVNGFSDILVVFGAHFSALWIIMANSWMQTPAGYTVQMLPAPARAYITSFMQVVFTPSFMPRILHVWFASWTAGSALMLSVSAGICLKNVTSK